MYAVREPVDFHGFVSIREGHAAVARDFRDVSSMFEGRWPCGSKVPESRRLSKDLLNTPGQMYGVVSDEFMNRELTGVLCEMDLWDQRMDAAHKRAMLTGRMESRRNAAVGFVSCALSFVEKHYDKISDKEGFVMSLLSLSDLKHVRPEYLADAVANVKGLLACLYNTCKVMMPRLCFDDCHKLAQEAAAVAVVKGPFTRVQKIFLLNELSDVNLLPDGRTNFKADVFVLLGDHLRAFVQQIDAVAQREDSDDVGERSRALEFQEEVCSQEFTEYWAAQSEASIAARSAIQNNCFVQIMQKGLPALERIKSSVQRAELFSNLAALVRLRGAS